MADVDFVDIAPRVGNYLLGEPTKQTSYEIRWGTHGSWCLNLESGLFYSFEEGQGGGVIWLIDYFNKSREEILNMYNPTKNINKPQKQYQTFSEEQMRALAKQSKVYLKYNNNFVVMRFDATHFIKQKYAPFYKENNVWTLKRPTGKMPIYFNNKEGVVIINEGEKATIGCSALYEGGIATWHGGVNSWQKCDWQPLANKNILIWPDNDEPGKTCAAQLQDYLQKNYSCNVAIATVPASFNDKDDLYDAYKNNLLSAQDLLNIVNTAQYEVPRSNLNLRKVSELINDISEPEWVIEDVMEKDSVMEIYGAPKSGKSFIAIDMAICASLGIDWHGHKCTQTPIIYLAGEGQRGIARRVQAWKHYYDKDVNNAKLFISDRGIRFLDEDDHANLVNHINDIKKVFGNIGAIFVDTLARNFGAGNENSTEDMNKFIEKVDALKNEFNCCVNLIHHTGHMASGRARGSSVLPAAVDAEFAVKRAKDTSDEMKVEFTQTLIKDGKPINPKYFKFVEIDLILLNGLTSGVLAAIDKSEYFNKEDSAIDETALLISELQKAKADKENVDPINIWVKQIDIINASEIKESAVKQRLKRLRENDKVHYEERKGYQSKNYDDIK